MGACTRRGTLSGREALSVRKQPAWRGAPSPNGGSGGRVRRAARWLGFKSLMHRLAEQWQQGCGGGGCGRSAGEQCPGRLTDSSSGPAEAPASAPEGAPSSAPFATCAARGKSRSSPSRSPPPPPAPPRISSIPTCPGFRTSPGERHDWIKNSPTPGPLLCHSVDKTDLFSGNMRQVPWEDSGRG